MLAVPYLTTASFRIIDPLRFSARGHLKLCSAGVVLGAVSSFLWINGEGFFPHHAFLPRWAAIVGGALWEVGQWVGWTLLVCALSV